MYDRPARSYFVQNRHNLAPKTLEKAIHLLYNENDKSYVRMYEHRGHDSSILLAYRPEKARLTEVGLAGREGEAVSGRLTFRPWQIRTVRIKPL